MLFSSQRDNCIKAIKFYHKDEVIDLLDQNVIKLIDVMYSHNVDYPPFETTTNGKVCYLMKEKNSILKI